MTVTLPEKQGGKFMIVKNFKKTLIVSIFYLCFCLVVSPVIAASDSEDNDAVPTENSSGAPIEDVKNQTQNAINEMLSISGAMLSGMSKGMQEGVEDIQKQLDSADGVRLIANKEDLAEFLQVSVLKLEEITEHEKGQWSVTLAIKNSNDFPVRLVNLTRQHSILMLDSEGFAYDPIRHEQSARTLTVAARTAIKMKFDFTGLEARPGVIRLFDTDFPLE